jgi:hypothetical protein
MLKEIEITISRADFGSQGKDLDLSKAKVWIDNVLVEPSSPREKDKFVGKAKVADNRTPSTLVLTTEAGTPIAFLKGDKIRFEEATPAPSSSSRSQPGGGKPKGTQGGQTTP